MQLDRRNRSHNNICYYHLKKLEIKERKTRKNNIKLRKIQSSILVSCTLTKFRHLAGISTDYAADKTKGGLVLDDVINTLGLSPKSNSKIASTQIGLLDFVE